MSLSRKDKIRRSADLDAENLNKRYGIKKLPSLDRAKTIKDVEMNFFRKIFDPEMAENIKRYPIIYNSDNRIPLGIKSLEAPWRTSVLIHILWKDKETATGSGILISGRVVLTAAHVVYSEEHGGFAQSLRVIPAADGPHMPFGDALGSLMYIRSKNHTADIFGSRRGYDIALIILDRDFFSITGATMERQVLDELEGKFFEYAGYPGDLPNDINAGTEMYYATGTIEDVDSDGQLEYYSDTSPGTSGSGLVVDIYGIKTVVGVNNSHIVCSPPFSPVGDPDCVGLDTSTNRGAAITEDFEKKIAEFIYVESPKTKFGKTHDSENWTNLGGNTRLSVSAVAADVVTKTSLGELNMKLIYVFMVGKDGSVFAKRRFKQNAANPFIENFWEQDWISLGGSTNFPVASATRNGIDVDVVIATKNGDLAVRTYSPTEGGWGKWIVISPPPGRIINATPTVVPRNPSSMDIFVNSQNTKDTKYNESRRKGEIWHISFDINGGFQQWHLLGGTILGPVNAVARIPNKSKIDIFVVAPSGDIYTAVWDENTPDALLDFISLPNVISTLPPVAIHFGEKQPALLCIKGSNVDLNVLGRSVAFNAPRQLPHIDSKLEDGLWESVGGSATSVSAISRSPGTIDAFIRHYSGTLYKASWNKFDGWTPWVEPLIGIYERQIWDYDDEYGPQIIEAPTIVKINNATGPASLLLFARDRNLNVIAKYFNSTDTPWSGWLPG